jgi:hypothetical protein
LSIKGKGFPVEIVGGRGEIVIELAADSTTSARSESLGLDRFARDQPDSPPLTLLLAGISTFHLHLTGTGYGLKTSDSKLPCCYLRRICCLALVRLPQQGFQVCRVPLQHVSVFLNRVSVLLCRNRQTNSRSLQSPYYFVSRIDVRGRRIHRWGWRQCVDPGIILPPENADAQRITAPIEFYDGILFCEYSAKPVGERVQIWTMTTPNAHWLPNPPSPAVQLG